MKYSNLRKNAACILSVFSLGTNSKLEGMKNSSIPSGKIHRINEEKLNEEINKNIENKNRYKENFAKLKIDTYIPNISQQANGKKQITKSIISLLIGLGIIAGLGWGIKSLVSVLWQRIVRGVHMKYSTYHKEMIRYLNELGNFTPFHVMGDGVTTKSSKDSKARMYYVNNYDNQAKVSVEAMSNGETVAIIFGKGDKDITVEKISEGIKKLCIIAGGCVKICNAHNVEFFYTKCSNLIISKENINDSTTSCLKEAILNIRNLSFENEDNKFNVVGSDNLLDLINSKKISFLGGSTSGANYKTIKGLISSNGFGENNWFTVYREENSSGNK